MSAFKKKLRFNFTLVSREQDDYDCEDKSEKEDLGEKLTIKEIAEALLQGQVGIEVPSQVHIVRIFTSSTFTGIFFCIRLTLQLLRIALVNRASPRPKSSVTSNFDIVEKRVKQIKKEDFCKRVKSIHCLISCFTWLINSD